MPWRTTPVAPDYEASRTGLVRRRRDRRRIRAHRQRRDRYWKIWLTVDGRRRAYRLHRLVAAAWGLEIEGRMVDHRDRRRGRNGIANLRAASVGENNANRRAKASASGYRGVCVEAGGRYRAYIRVEGRTKALGRFDDAVEAARAYDRAAAARSGGFAVLNFPMAGGGG